MRRTLASLVVLVSTAGLLVGLAGTASAAAVSTGCAAVSDVPHLNVGGSSRIVTTGRFECLAAATGMTITVCIQEQYNATSPWWSRGCTTVNDLYEYRSSISATHSMSVPVYATWLRTTVTARNDAGHSSTFASPPAFWFNCACYIG